MERESVRYAVSGANGYIGSVVARYLRSQGGEVVELNRRAVAGMPGNRIVPFRLGEGVPVAAFDRVDALVHCAYDFGAAKWADIKRSNVDGSLSLFSTASSAGVRRMVFISTLSAFEGCRSQYGRAKLMVEEASREWGVVSVRPGLVFDEGDPRGMVGALARVAGRSPVVPLIGGGKQVLYPCHSEDLARLVHYLCTTAESFPKPVAAASTHGLQFVEILRQIAYRRGRRVRFFPIPYRMALIGLRSIEAIGVRTRLRSDSLVSLVNQPRNVDFSGLARTGLSFREFGSPSA